MLAVATQINSHVSFDFGAGRWSGQSRSGDLYLVPSEVEPAFVVDGPNEYISIGIPFSTLASLLDEVQPSLRDFGRLHGMPFRDPLIEILCARLWAEAANDNPLRQLFVDTAVQTLAVALVGAAGHEHDHSKPRLSSPRLGRTIEYIEAHLDDDLAIADLATVAAMSNYEFARAFKAAVGMSPLKYVTQRRVDRAKEMLNNSGLSVTEIALACGFCNSQHFATIFRRLVHATPTAYRQEGQRIFL